MDMATDDWKAVRTERARIELVERMDAARRVTALEAALRYESEAADRMRTQMMASIECAAIERAEHADTLAHRDSVIAQQAATVGTLRTELAAAMRTIESWSEDRAPKLSAGLRRCDASYCGMDVVCDYRVIEGNSGDDDQPDAVAELSSVWVGTTDIMGAISDDCYDRLEQQAQQALDDWCADERDELATAGVPSLREAQEVAA